MAKKYENRFLQLDNAWLIRALHKNRQNRQLYLFYRIQGKVGTQGIPFNF